MNYPYALTSEQTKMPRCSSSRHLKFVIDRNAGLAGPIVAAYPVTLLISS